MLESHDRSVAIYVPVPRLPAAVGNLQNLRPDAVAKAAGHPPLNVLVNVLSRISNAEDDRRQEESDGFAFVILLKGR